MKKIGLLCLALVLALGSLGIGYASWTDTITIDGTVNTGDVDINVKGLSQTYVFKNLGTDEIETVHTWARTQPPTPSNWLLIASATARVTGDDTVIVTFDNLFPSVDFKVDYLLHYAGSIPAKFVVGTDDPPAFTPTDPGNAADVDLAAYLNQGWNIGTATDGYLFYGEMWESNNAAEELVNIEYLEGYQLHECNYILVVITLHLGQDAPMNGSVDFTDEFKVIQWNEYNNEEPNNTGA